MSGAGEKGAAPDDPGAKPERVEVEATEAMEGGGAPAAIVPATGAMPSYGLSEALLKHAERQVELGKKAKVIALRSTSAEDWVLIDGKPYLAQHGCKKVAQVFGVEISQVRMAKEREEIGGEDRITYIAEAEFTCAGRTITEIGAASSVDKFFAQRSEWTDGKKKTVRIPLAEIDLPSVRKKALTNCYNRGIKGVLGIGTVEPKDLIAAGIDLGKVGTVEHSKTDKSAGDSPEQGEKRDRIREMCLDLAGGDKTKAVQILKDATAWKTDGGEEVPGKGNVKDLTQKQVDRHANPGIKGTIADKWTAWKKAQDKAGGQEPGQAPAKEK